MPAPATKKRKASRVPTRDRILSAAVELFAAQGFNGTTTREIARKARANEALIFRYFPRKRDLYAAIIERRIQDQPAAELLDASLAKGEDDQSVLCAIALRMFETVEKDPSFLRLFYFSALEGHELSQMFYNTFVHRLNTLLRRYVQRRIEEGRFRSVDPHLAARAFVGMVAHYLLAKELFPARDRRFNKERVVEAFVSLFLNGISASK